MRIERLDHVSIIVSDAERARAFYQAVLGLSPVERPDLGFPGYWLDLGAGQTLHLMQLPDPCEGCARPEHGGRDYHFALRVSDLDEWATHLERHGVAFTRSKSGRMALFLHDLDGNVIELTQSVQSAERGVLGKR